MPAWKARSAEFKKMWGYSVGFYGVWVAHVGRKAGLFEAIAKRPISPADLAVQAKLDQKAVEQKEAEKQRLLEETKGQESLYQTLKSSQQQLASQIRADHGSVFSTPSAVLILLSNITHVDGMNCVGPIAPPNQPMEFITPTAVARRSGLTTSYSEAQMLAS